MNERIYGIILNYLTALISAVISIIYVPLLLGFIGKTEYGIYQLIGALVGYITVIEGSIAQGVTQYYTKFLSVSDKPAMENLLALAFRIYAGAVFLIIGLGTVFYQQLGHIFGSVMTLRELGVAQDLFILLIINLVLSILSSPVNSVITAHQCFRFQKSVSLIQLLLQPILAVTLLYAFPSALTIVVVQTCLNILAWGCRWYYALRYLQMRVVYHYWDWSVMRPFMVLVSSILGVVVIDQIFFRTNQVIIGVLQGPATVAVYAVAATIYMQYMGLSTMICGVFGPRMVTMISQKRPIEEISALFIKIGRWQWFVLAYILTGFIIFGRFFISWWVGSDFLESYYITLLLIVPFSIDLVQNIGNTILQAYNRYGYRAKVFLLVGTLCLACAIPATQWWGALGAAACTGLSWFIISGLIMNRYYARVIGLDIREFWRQLGHITLYVGAIFIPCYVVSLFVGITSLKLFLIGGALYSLLYGWVIFKWGMNETEKRKIQRLFVK